MYLIAYAYRSSTNANRIGKAYPQLKERIDKEGIYYVNPSGKRSDLRPIGFPKELDLAGNVHSTEIDADTLRQYQEKLFGI